MRNSLISQLQACDNAIKLEAAPITISKTKLPDNLAMVQSILTPQLVLMVIQLPIQSKGASQTPFTSLKKERGKWQPPIEITLEINAGEDCSTCSLNNNGTELFLYKKIMKTGTFTRRHILTEHGLLLKN